LQVKAGFRCSHHLHTHRKNLFAVLSGAIEVCENLPEGGTQVTRMRAGDVHEVAAGIVHCFYVRESGEVIEVYSPGFDGAKVELDDIVRSDEGGSI
jgi:quercetin dioxygenase-like cupin family protein